MKKTVLRQPKVYMALRPDFHVGDKRIPAWGGFGKGDRRLKNVGGGS